MTLIHTLFAGVLAVYAGGDECTLPSQADVARLKRQADAAYKAGKMAIAAELWREVVRLYPTCAVRQRRDAVIRTLNVLERVPATAAKSCDGPRLQSARLVRQIHEELLAQVDDAPDLKRAREAFSDRLAQLEPAAAAAAMFLDGPLLPPGVLRERYAEAVTNFGVCPDLRAALVRHVFAAIPADLPPPPACGESERARELLRAGMEALEQAEPATAASTAEYGELTRMLKKLEGPGATLSVVRTRAIAETDNDSAAEGWAAVAQGLPTCSEYLSSKYEATVAAVDAWQRGGEHRLSASERFRYARGLLDRVLAALERDHGPEASKLREHQSLMSTRATLAPPPVVAKPPMPTIVPPRPKASAPEKWISRYRPERNMFEVGAILGVMAPSSGLLPSNAGGSHQLFNPYLQRDSLIAGGVEFYKPYRKVAPEFGARIAFYPLNFLGGEIEGGAMPTRVVVDGTPGEGAVLFNARAHLIGQLPRWRVTPFVLIGGGALGTTGALGKDTDPTLNFGGGVKVYVSRHFMVRLDFRDSVGDRKGITTGGTHYPELLLGLSVTLNRRQEASRPSPQLGASTSPKKEASKGGSR